MWGMTCAQRGAPEHASCKFITFALPHKINSGLYIAQPGGTASSYTPWRNELCVHTQRAAQPAASGLHMHSLYLNNAHRLEVAMAGVERSMLSNREVMYIFNCRRGDFG